MKTHLNSPRAEHRREAQKGAARDRNFYVHRHQVIGWWSLLVFLCLGICLEGLHALKVGWYLDVANETRRLMWTLGHAHGTLLALVNLALASTLATRPNWFPKTISIISASLLAASLLIPGGFILGGITIHSGDPGLGILLLPLGAGLLLISVFLVARAVTRVGSNHCSIGEFDLPKEAPGAQEDSQLALSKRRGSK